MRRILREISYDLREPGTHMLAIPVIALLFVLLTLFVQARFSAMERQNTFTLFALELLFPFLGGYAAIALMRGIFDAEGGETLFTYGKSFFYWGWIRQMRFFALYAILVAAVSVCTAAILHGSIMDIFTVTLAQCFAVMGVAFFGVCVSKRTDGGVNRARGFCGDTIDPRKRVSRAELDLQFFGLRGESHAKKQYPLRLRADWLSKLVVGAVVGAALTPFAKFALDLRPACISRHR